jgi:large subunit ribosomal protein L29
MPALREFRELDDNELLQELDDYRRELFNLRFQLATGRLDNVSRIREVKREIARIMTLFTERDLGIDRSESDKKALEREKSAIERSAEEPRRKRLRQSESDEEVVTDFNPSSEDELTEDEV